MSFVQRGSDAKVIRLFSMELTPEAGAHVVAMMIISSCATFCAVTVGIQGASSASPALPTLLVRPVGDA